MNHHLARVAARLFNAPLLVIPGVAETIASNLSARFGVEPMVAPSATLAKAKTFGDDIVVSSASDDDRKPYDVIEGVAVVSIRGELVNRGSWLDAYSGLASYEAIANAVSTAAADEDVIEIALDIDSPGGEAAGAMETAGLIREASAIKCVTAIVNSTAASAAYALASGASRIWVSPSAMVGSIGVVWLHMDYSKALDGAGLKPTLLHSGDFKIDGTPLKPLPADARARIQATIDEYYALFVGTVGKMRPGLGVEGARKTEAGVFVGQSAIEALLADKIGNLSDLIAAVATRGQGVSSAFAKSRALLRAPRANQGAGMTVKLNKGGESHADSLIDKGAVDTESPWKFSAKDGDDLLGDDGDDWDNYSAFHLGLDEEAADKTKARWKYPYGKGGKVYRSGLIAAKTRAAQQGDDSIAEAAGKLVDKIDANEKEKAAMVDQQAIAAAKTEGALAERERISAILNSEEAKDRPGAALAMAIETDMAPAAALKVLGKTAKETVAPTPAPPSKGKLDAIVPRPGLSSDPAPAPEPENDYEKGRVAFAGLLSKK